MVFVRKSLVEVQYLRTTIADEQREEFGYSVEGTIRRIESADFLPHSGIHFLQNPCSRCPYVGLCLGKQEMIDAAVVWRPGAYELEALRGGPECLTSAKAVIAGVSVIEYYEGQCLFRNIVSYLAQFGALHARMWSKCATG